MRQKPKPGEKWRTGCEMREVMHVVENEMARRQYMVLVHQSFPDSGSDAVVRVWMRGGEWSAWKASRKAKLVTP